LLEGQRLPLALPLRLLLLLLSVLQPRWHCISAAAGCSGARHSCCSRACDHGAAQLSLLLLLLVLLPYCAS
jgi:hypothetical protein